MEKNEFNELLDGIIECADKVAKLGRLLKEVLPQLAEQTTEAPTDVPAVEEKETKSSTDKKKSTTKVKRSSSTPSSSGGGLSVRRQRR